MIRNLLTIITYQLASPRDRLHRESRERLHREATELLKSDPRSDRTHSPTYHGHSPSLHTAGAASAASAVRLRVRRPPEMGWEEAA